MEKKVKLNFMEKGVTLLYGSSNISLVTCDLGADVKILMTNQKVTNKVSKINSASSS